MEYWYFVTGPKHFQDLHATHMQGVDCYIPGLDATGKFIQQQIKMGFEPIQLVRLVFPREALPIVVNTMGKKTSDKFAVNAAGIALRKTLGLQEIPVVGESSRLLPVSMDYLNIIPLGIKDDGPDRIIYPTGVKQEPL